MKGKRFLATARNLFWIIFKKYSSKMDK